MLRILKRRETRYIANTVTKYFLGQNQQMIFPSRILSFFIRRCHRVGICIVKLFSKTAIYFAVRWKWTNSNDLSCFTLQFTCKTRPAQTKMKMVRFCRNLIFLIVWVCLFSFPSCVTYSKNFGACPQRSLSANA